MLQAFANGTVFGESYGDGAPQVLWLHGWQRSKADFAAAATTLAHRGIASVALDLPGFGSSPPPPHAGGARYYSDLVATILRDDLPRPVVLVGHSFGGRVGVVLAARHPDHVTGLVLTGVPLLPREGRSTSPLAYRVIRSLSQRGLVSTARLEAARQKYGSADYRQAQGVMRDVLVASVNERYDDELRQWRGPTVLLWGDGDSDVPVDVASRAAEILPCHPHVTVLEGVGHLTPTAAPDAVASAVAALLGDAA